MFREYLCQNVDVHLDEKEEQTCITVRRLHVKMLTRFDMNTICFGIKGLGVRKGC